MWIGAKADQFGGADAGFIRARHFIEVGAEFGIENVVCGECVSGV